MAQDTRQMVATRQSRNRYSRWKSGSGWWPRQLAISLALALRTTPGSPRSDMDSAWKSARLAGNPPYTWLQGAAFEDR
jgi:hypothetical protein